MKKCFILIITVIFIFTGCNMRIKYQGNLKEIKKIKQLNINSRFDEMISINGKFLFEDPSTDINSFFDKTGLKLFHKQNIDQFLIKDKRAISEYKNLENYFRASIKDKIRLINIRENYGFSITYDEELFNNQSEVNTDNIDNIDNTDDAGKFYLDIVLISYRQGEFNLVENIPSNVIVQYNVYNYSKILVAKLEKQYTVQSNIETPYEKKRINEFTNSITKDIIKWISQKK